MTLIHNERLVRCSAVSTLVWDGDDLVDVTSGIRLHNDGTISSGTISAAYSFDRAIGLRQDDTLWSVAYANRQTKAILLKDGQLHRELNRSFYFADTYDYPIALAHGSGGRVLLIHCPNEFDTLEVQDAETGVMLTREKGHSIEFHSRLTVSSDSRYLLDAGWFWHPVGGAWLCDLKALLEHQDSQICGCSFSFGAEVDSVGFLGNDHVVVTSTDEVVNDETPPTGIGPRQLGLWTISNSCWRSQVALSGPAGIIMPWRDWVISFYEFPKAIEIATGRVAHAWEKIYSGRQVGTIDLGDPPPPAMALDAHGGRFAIQTPDGVVVVNLDSLD